MNDTQLASIPRGMCSVRAYAKINLTLDVLGRRSDGYHELATIMQTIDLYDTICMTIAGDSQMHMTCSREDLSRADNLAARAAQLVRQRVTNAPGLRIELNKRIPVAAGLGGGSSDAAAVLLALRQWWGLDFSQQEMLDMAASLGSDVPFFLTGGLALCEGRGERVTPLAHYWPTTMRWLLLLKPSISISTATVFRNLTSRDYSDGKYTRSACSALSAHTNPKLEDVHNGLERSVLETYPAVKQGRQAMLHAGAPFVRLSGSGPTLFAPFSELAAALQTQQYLQAQGYEVHLACPVQPNMESISVFE